MCHRTNWTEPFSVVSTLFNFKWQELSYGIDYNTLGNNIACTNLKQIVNHFENHFAISNKEKMFINLMNYCEKRKISVFKYLPFTIIYKLKENDNEIKNVDIENMTAAEKKKLEKRKEENEKKKIEKLVFLNIYLLL